MKGLIVVVIVLVSISCVNVLNVYENKSEYHIKAGESVEIYQKNNSCCTACVSNVESLRFTEYMGRSSRELDGDCAGCSYTIVFSFKGNKSGSDTIRIARQEGGSDCGEEPFETHQYVIHVE